MSKLYLRTYGCQMNEYDSERVAGLLKQERYELTDRPEDADLILLNTCSIREKAEDKVFSQLGALRHLKRERPHLVIGPRDNNLLPRVIERARQAGIGPVLVAAAEEEIAADALDIRIARTEDGHGNWAPVFKPRGGGGTFTFAGIDTLRIATVGVADHRASDTAAGRWEITGFEAAVPETRAATARGLARLGRHQVEFSVGSVPLAKMVASGSSIPVAAEIRLASARLRLDGSYAPAGEILWVRPGAPISPSRS